MSQVFSTCRTHAAVLVRISSQFLLCHHICMCKKQTGNHENWGENRSVLWPWHSLGTLKREMLWDLSSVRFALYEAQKHQQRWGGWTEAPPGASSPPCRWHTQVSCQRRNTQLYVFTQGLFIFSFGETEIPSQWCQLIQGHVPGGKIKIHPALEVVCCPANVPGASCFLTRGTLVKCSLGS